MQREKVKVGMHRSFDDALKPVAIEYESCLNLGRVQRF